VAAYPSSDESFALLHAAGGPWGELPLLTDDGPVWLVTGTNWENVVEARTATQAEAWHRAAKRARSLGMLGRLLLLIGGYLRRLMGTIRRALNARARPYASPQGASACRSGAR
jgi:hypothetical protein